MLNARTIAVIAAALSNCSAAARAAEAAAPAAPSVFALPEPRALVPLAIALIGLAHIGRSRRR